MHTISGRIPGIAARWRASHQCRRHEPSRSLVCVACATDAELCSACGALISAGFSLVRLRRKTSRRNYDNHARFGFDYPELLHEIRYDTKPIPSSPCSISDETFYHGRRGLESLFRIALVIDSEADQNLGRKITTSCHTGSKLALGTLVNLIAGFMENADTPRTAAGLMLGVLASGSRYRQRCAHTKGTRRTCTITAARRPDSCIPSRPATVAVTPQQSGSQDGAPRRRPRCHPSIAIRRISGDQSFWQVGRREWRTRTARPRRRRGGPVSQRVVRPPSTPGTATQPVSLSSLADAALTVARRPRSGLGCARGASSTGVLAEGDRRLCELKASRDRLHDVDRLQNETVPRSWLGPHLLDRRTAHRARGAPRR